MRGTYLKCDYPHLYNIRKAADIDTRWRHRDIFCGANRREPSPFVDYCMNLGSLCLAQTRNGWVGGLGFESLLADRVQLKLLTLWEALYLFDDSLSMRMQDVLACGMASLVNHW